MFGFQLLGKLSEIRELPLESEIRKRTWVRETSLLDSGSFDATIPPEDHQVIPRLMFR